MKRKFFVLVISLILILNVFPGVLAADPDSPRVVDNAGLLSSEELADLTKLVYQQRYSLELEIAIVTTWSLDGKSVQAYADDFYDINGYGYGDSNSGILLLIAMDTREWYMSTCGEAIYIFTDYGLDILGENLVSYLAEGDYYQGFTQWVNNLTPYVEAYRSGTPIDGYVPPDDYDSPFGEEIVYYEEDSSGSFFLIALIIGLVAAVVTILIMRSTMNTAKLQRGAVDYLKEGSFRITQRYDMFLYSRVSRTAKPKNNSGGSSVHRSSGGISHGGRGGRF